MKIGSFFQHILWVLSKLLASFSTFCRCYKMGNFFQYSFIGIITVGSFSAHFVGVVSLGCFLEWNKVHVVYYILVLITSVRNCHCSSFRRG